MASIVVNGDTSGSITLSAPAVAGSSVLTLPAVTDTVAGIAATQTLTNKSIVATQLTGTIAAARLPAGSVLQVVSAAKTDTFSQTQSANSISGTDVTSLIATITPTSTSSKILVIVNLNLGSAGTTGTGDGIGFVLYRSGTAISIGDAASSRTRLTSSAAISSNRELIPMGMNFLDAPSTTSSISYSVRLWQGSGATVTAYVNRNNEDSDGALSPRGASSITVMEIAV